MFSQNFGEDNEYEMDEFCETQANQEKKEKACVHDTIKTVYEYRDSAAMLHRETIVKCKKCYKQISRKLICLDELTDEQILR